MRILKDANKKYCFIMDMEVRDYELDCEQIVNNANYLHYMEHERKGPRFIFHQDIIRSDGEMCAEGVVTVVVLKDGKLSRGDELAKVFGRYIQ